MAQVEWNGDNAEKIQKALHSAFPDEAQLRDMVFGVLGVELNTLVAVGHLTVPQAIFALCRQVNATGDLDKLIKGAHSTNSGNPELRALHVQFFGGTLGGGMPVKLYERSVLAGDTVFFDRQRLRYELERIDGHEVRRILVVTGDRKSGKSYTDRLIRQEAKERQYETITLRLRALPKKEPVKALAISIAGEMQPDSFDNSAPVQGNESDVRWAHHPLMVWTLGWMRRAPGTWWIIFDEFERDLVDPLVYGFLIDLAARVEDDLPTCRLAMLGFDQPIPPEWAGKYRHEEIESMEREHLEQFFDGLYRQKGLEPDTATTTELAQLFYKKYQAHKLKLVSNSEPMNITPARQFLNDELADFAGKQLDPPGA